MKKSLLTIAAAATMVAPAIAMADATLYGNLHVSINDFDTAENINMTSNTSAIGVKGSEDLGDGVKAIYKMEFQVDVSDNGDTAKDPGSAKEPKGFVGVVNRDQFVGLKGGMGTIKFGTMSSNYKQMGGKVDPLYRTRLEGRGFLGTQSSLHKGRGITSGRQTNTVQYTSPKMSGIQLVANTTVSGVDDETNGIGVRWSNKNILAYFDWIDNDLVGDATKIGGRYKTKAFSAGLQYETAESAAGAEVDRIFLSGAYNINKNNSVILTAGQIDPDGGEETTGIALAYNHKLSKMTNVYIGYGDRSSDAPGVDEDVITAGIKKKF